MVCYDVPIDVDLVRGYKIGFIFAGGGDKYFDFFRPSSPVNYGATHATQNSPQHLRSLSNSPTLHPQDDHERSPEGPARDWQPPALIQAAPYAQLADLPNPELPNPECHHDSSSW